MPSITKTFHTSTGHRLPGHDGECRNLHGHNYEIEIEFVRRGGRLDDQGMVVDFGVVKNIAGTVIDDLMDHKFLVWKHDPLKTAFLEMDRKIHHSDMSNGIVIIENPPTAENIGFMLFKFIASQTWPPLVEIRRIKVQETPSAYAEVFHS